MRIEAVLRRCSGADIRLAASGNGNKTYGFKNLVLDDSLKEARVKGNLLELTAKEYEILKLLTANPRKLFSKANLYESVWNEPYYAEDNTLKVHMSNIRNKIKKYDSEEYIETVWGMGYKIKSEKR